MGICDLCEMEITAVEGMTCVECGCYVGDGGDGLCTDCASELAS